MAEQMSGLFWKDRYVEQLHEELSSTEKQLRDLFVEEYLKDHDRLAAAIRCGFGKGYAKQYADQFWEEPYVQQKISKISRQALDPTEEQKQEHRAIVINTLLQAAQNGPYASRVSAARELATLYGWNKPTKDMTEEESMISLLKEFAQKAPV